ncbi:hypothetical protein [Kitasatospora sp. NPDC057223]
MIADIAVRTTVDQAWLLLILAVLLCVSVALIVIAYTAWSTPND